MAAKLLIIALFAVFFLVGSTQLRLNKEGRPGRVARAVEDAKAHGKQEVNLPAPIPIYAYVKNLDDALATFTTVVAKPIQQYSFIEPDSQEIETWYKFEVVDLLSEPKEPKCKTCSAVQNIPQQIQPVESNQFVIRRRAGSVILDGVKVNSKDATFPDFTVGHEYFLFVSLDYRTRLASLDLGPSGVSTIQSDGSIKPVHEKTKRLPEEVKSRYGKLDKIKEHLRFRRFPD